MRSSDTSAAATAGMSCTSTARSASPTRSQYFVIVTLPTGVQCESRSTAGGPGSSTAKRAPCGAKTGQSAGAPNAIAARGTASAAVMASSTAQDSTVVLLGEAEATLSTSLAFGSLRAP